MSHDVEIETPHVDSGSGAPIWARKAAFSTMFMGLFVAIAALFSGITAHSSLMGRTEEIMDLASVRSDKLHVEVLKSKHAMLNSLGKTVDTRELEHITAFEAESEKLMKDFVKMETKVSRTDHLHLIFAIGAAILSVSICLTGMSIISKYKEVWYFATCLGITGIAIVLYGLQQYLL